MQKNIRISIYDGQEYEVKKLQKLLKPYGISVDVMERDGGNVSWKFLQIEYDLSEIKNKQTRGAGRKKIQLEKSYTVGEIREMKQRMTGDEMAKELGISRKTLYRRLKECEGASDDKTF